MSARTAMRVVGAGRLAIGLGMVAAPVALGKPWVGEAADLPGGQVVVRSLGAREVLLGFMAVHVAGARDPLIAARWSAAIAVCDLVDGVATGAARDDAGPKADAVIAIALGTAVAGWGIARRLRAA
ncbi:MAG TPA: hypothetical protein VII98_13085 [Solirubrobacteraceae bacterium]